MPERSALAQYLLRVSGLSVLQSGLCAGMVCIIGVLYELL